MREQKHSIDFLFSMMAFLVYAAAMLAFTGFGAGVYRSVTARMESNHTVGTVRAYFTEKIRQHDAENAVTAGEIEGEPALIIRETLGEKEYLTYIYAEEGMLKELLIPAGREAVRSEGTEILALDQFWIEEFREGCFRIGFTEEDGIPREFIIARKGGI